MEKTRTPRFRNVKCKDHAISPKFFCCGKLICEKCLSEHEHSEHSYQTITEKMCEIKDKIPEMKQKLKTIRSRLNDNLWNLEELLSRNSDECNKNRNRIHQRIKEIISYLTNTIEPVLKTECENRHQEVKTKLNHLIDECNSKLSEISCLRDKCDKLLGYSSEVETVRVGIDIDTEIQADISAEKQWSPYCTEIPEFITPSALPDKNVLRRILGTFNDGLEMDSDWSTSDNEKFTIIEKFKWKSKNISLAVLEEERAWIHSVCSGGSICQVSIKGNILLEKQNEKGRKIDNICATQLKNSWVTDTNSCSIKVLRENGKMEHKFHVHPFHPYGICSTLSGDGVWVCLADKESFIPGLNGKTKVAKMSLSGETVCEIESQCNTPYFSFPYRCAENINSDLWVIDRLLLEAKGQVIIFDKTGQPKSGYIGTASDKDFDPRDICSTPKGNIIISDCANNAIHILNLDGMVERLLRMDTHHDLIQPISVSCFKSKTTSDNKIWISFSSGSVAVIKTI